jgi:hypothetical protein
VMRFFGGLCLGVCFFFCARSSNDEISHQMRPIPARLDKNWDFFAGPARAARFFLHRDDRSLRFFAARAFFDRDLPFPADRISFSGNSCSRASLFGNSDPAASFFLLSPCVVSPWILVVVADEKKKRHPHIADLDGYDAIPLNGFVCCFVLSLC